MLVNKSMYPVSLGFSTAKAMQQRFDSLQIQLATGKKANTLAEMGTDRVYDLAMRGKLGRIGAYQESIKMVGLRLDAMDLTIGRLDQIEADARASVAPGAYGAEGMYMTTATSLAAAQLDEVLDLLGMEVNGRHLFGGANTDSSPVAGFSAIMDGQGGRDGFRTVLGERKLADAGADGMGRLTLGVAGAAVTLGEDGDHPFGFKLGSISSSGGGVALTQATGTPPEAEIAFTAQPLPGQVVTVGLTLPDGRSATVELKAVTGEPAGPGEFRIGADEEETAANFAAALEDRLLTLGGTTLAAASTYAAAENFFNGRGEPVLRVEGPSFESATALVAGTEADTVFWYTGTDSPGNPRQSVTARVDEHTVVGYGVEANERGIVELIRNLAAFAAETFDPKNDPTANERFDIMAKTQRSRLSEASNNTPGSIDMIAMELGVARNTLGNVDDRHTAYKAQLQTMLADLEQAPLEQVAMEALALRTRLEASYATMAMVSQLSLVNFVR